MKILKPLLYFSLFNHPLTKEEIFSYSTNNTLENTTDEVNHALSKNIISQTDEYYHLHLKNESINKRKTGEVEAKNALIKAKKRAKFIYKYFPFIEGISISGSLSKGYFDKNSDVDFFIITKPNRLWTCRMILILFKKIFLFNSKKYFCMNYFISSDNLEIMEKNIFTATEIATLIPLHGTIFKDFFRINSWYKNFLPNKENNLKSITKANKSFFSKTIEKTSTKIIGDFFEKTCFMITYSVWKIKYRKKMNSEDFAIAFKSSKKVSKHHPSNFQKKVINALNEEYKLMKEKYNVDIPNEHV